MSSVLLALVLLLAPAGDDNSLTEEQIAALPDYFGFGTIEIYKLQPSINGLHLADLNRDGKDDIVLWNPFKSRFELLYQPGPNTPDKQDEALEQNEIPNRGHLRNDTVAVNYNVATLAVAELTGDAYPDIVFFGEPREVVVLPGKKEGGFGPANGFALRRAARGVGRSWWGISTMTAAVTWRCWAASCC
jgi:hypothetical protein